MASAVAASRLAGTTDVARWSFTRARAYARSLQLKTSTQFVRRTKRRDYPPQMPATPWDFYQAQWKGWQDFLGDSYQGRALRRLPAEVKRPFEEVRTHARRLGFTSPLQWVQYARKSDTPAHLKVHPRFDYPNEFRGWDDFLGFSAASPAKQPTNILPFEEAREKVRALGFRRIFEYNTYVRAHPRSKLSPVPQSDYKHLWHGWRDYFGSSTSRTGSSRAAQKLPAHFKRPRGRPFKQGSPKTVQSRRAARGGR